MKRRILIPIWIAFLAVGFDAFAQAEPPYKALDSGFPVDAVLRDIHWIDNDRVLFKGVVLGTYKEHGPFGPNYGGYGLVETAHVWNVRANRVTPYGYSLRGLRDFCSNKGYVSYEWGGKIYAGRFGEEKVVPGIDRAVHFAWRNRFSCKVHPGLREFEKWRKDNSREALELLEEHGWLDIGPALGAVTHEEYRKLRKIVLYKSPKSAGTEISIPNYVGPNSNKTREIRYMPWANQYFLRGDWGTTSKVDPAWFLRPDGSVTEVKWPEGEWQVGLYYPTRMGVLVGARKRTGPNSWWSGHFLIDQGKATKIGEGFWKGTGISPDGCKVAFRYAKNPDDEIRGFKEWKAGRVANTLQIIDLCQGATK